MSWKNARRSNFPNSGSHRGTICSEESVRTAVTPFPVAAKAGRGLVASAGGTQHGESAVASALKWLAAHQMPDGGWSFGHRLCPGCQGKCSNPGDLAEARNAATGLALLAYLGAGQTHEDGKYQSQVKAGLDYLVNHAKVDKNGGSLYETGGRMYSHGICSIAMCEAYAMTHDKELFAPAQRALDFIGNAQDPVGGGWRYQPQVFAGLAERMGDTIELDGGVLEARSDQVRGATSSFGPTPASPWKGFATKPPKERSSTSSSYSSIRRWKDLEARLELSPPGIGDELREVRKQPTWSEMNAGRERPFTHQMISSRLRNVANSVGQTQANLRQDANRARLHPADLAALGIEDGDRIRIANGQGSVEAIASGSEDVRAGVVSIAHCWGQDDGDAGDVAVTRRQHQPASPAATSSSTAITGQPAMSAVPVTISPA